MLAPGVSYLNDSDKKIRVDFAGMLNAIGLGASGTDYVWVGERDYSFGSGFGAQAKLKLALFDDALKLRMMANNSTLYSWKGYDAKRTLYVEHPMAMIVQGEKGHTNCTFVECGVGYLSKHNFYVVFCLRS